MRTGPSSTKKGSPQPTDDQIALRRCTNRRLSTSLYVQTMDALNDIENVHCFNGSATIDRNLAITCWCRLSHMHDPVLVYTRQTCHDDVRISVAYTLSQCRFCHSD